MRQTIISFVTLTGVFAALTCVAAGPVDYSRRLISFGAVPEYPVAYEVPTTDVVREVVDRVTNHVISSTSLRVFDSRAGVEITTPDLANPNPDAVIDGRYTPFNHWDYPNGVTWSAFHRLTDITGDQRYSAHAVRVYDWIFTWMPYFREQEKRTNKPHVFSKMIRMAALDHCGAITAGLIRTQLRAPDPRFRAWIDVVDDYISKRQFRLPDGTLARERPQAVSLWTDDFYMGISFLAQMGRLTDEAKYWDLESSASAMFVYALARGVNEGWLSPIYGPAAITGWNGLATRVLADGRVAGICEGTTYANDHTYYAFRGAGSDTTFVGPIVYAGAEVIRLLQNPKLQIAAPRANAVNSALHLKAAP